MSIERSAERAALRRAAPRSAAPATTPTVRVHTEPCALRNHLLAHFDPPEFEQRQRCPLDSHGLTVDVKFCEIQT